MKLFPRTWRQQRVQSAASSPSPPIVHLEVAAAERFTTLTLDVSMPVTTRSASKRRNSSKGDMDAFLAMVEAYRANPAPDMVELLTERVKRMEDLREEDQQRCFDHIESLALQHYCVEMDSSSCRLVEMICGISMTTSSAEYTNALVDVCLGALVTGDDAVLRETMKKLIHALGIPPEQFAIPTSITFKHLAHVLRFTPNVPMGSVKASPMQCDALKQVFACSAQRCGLVLQDVFEILSPRSQSARDDVFRTEPTRLLCHCTRDRANLSSILSQGLQVKGTGGRLGPAIYLADELDKSLQYCHRCKLEDGNTYAAVFIVQAALGRCFETMVDMNAATAPPAGFDSIFARGVDIRAGAAKEICFSDGTSSFITPVNHLQHRMRSSQFAFNEYTLYTPDRVRLRFMLLFTNLSGETTGAGELGHSLFARTPLASKNSNARNGQPPSLSSPQQREVFLQFQAMQRQSQYRKKLVERIHEMSQRFGIESPQTARIRQILEEASEGESLEVFTKVRRV